MLDFVLNFLFPPSCIICGKYNQNYICNLCEKRFLKYRKYHEIDNLNIIKNKFAKLNLNKSYKYYLIDNQKLYWDKLFYVFKYEGIVRKYLLEYKFGDKPYICNFFAYQILKSKKVYEILRFCDIIAPVPLDKYKENQRGYNQTELITNILSRKVKIKSEKLLLKIRQTKTQSLLENSERKKNVENAFSIKNPELVKNKTILVLDDIYTTGATVNEISKILKEAGAKNVYLIVIAKD